MNLLPGTKLGDYFVLDVIETPRFGVAYRVSNERMGSRIEHLRILGDEKRGEEETERFLREIRVHSSLWHPNLIRFYEAARIEGKLVLTTEFVAGTTLADRLAAGALPLPQAVDYARQFLRGLEAAHNESIVHREVAPVHILITGDGSVKLGGFGLAKNQNDPSLTQAGTVMGWLEYIAPEQVQGMAWVDARADVYSAGCVLYEMVAGRPPFLGASQFDLMMAHVKETPRPPIELNPEISPELNQVVLKALAKGRYERYSSAGHFREALETVPEIAAFDATAAVSQAAPEPAEEEPPILMPVVEPGMIEAALAVEDTGPVPVAPGRSEPVWQVIAAGLVTFAVILTLIWWISLPKG